MPDSATTDIAQLAAALAGAQGELRNPEASSTNPHFRSRYADLASVLDAVRAPLAKHGLAVTQLLSTCPIDGEAIGVEVLVETLLLHESGQSLATTVGLPVSVGKGQNLAQAVGAATTYLRRYALTAMLGVAQDDDDGNSVASPDATSDPRKLPAANRMRARLDAFLPDMSPSQVSAAEQAWQSATTVSELSRVVRRAESSVQANRTPPEPAPEPDEEIVSREDLELTPLPTFEFVDDEPGTRS